MSPLPVLTFIPVQSVKTATIMPVVDAVTYTNSALMTDKSYVFHQLGKRFTSHQSVYHMAKEYSRGDVNINTAESIGAMLERAKTGAFHYISSMHLNLYLTELSFRWFNRDPKKVVTKTGKKKLQNMSSEWMKIAKGIASALGGQFVKEFGV